jgi:hypothetical protein
VYVGGACDGDEERRDFSRCAAYVEWIAQGGIKERRERWRGLYLAIAGSGERYLASDLAHIWRDDRLDQLPPLRFV